MPQQGCNTRMAGHYRVFSLLLLIQLSLTIPHHDPREAAERFDRGSGALPPPTDSGRSSEAWQAQLGGDAGGASPPPVPGIPGILAINTWPWPRATAGAFAQLAAGRSAVDGDHRRT